MENKEFKKMFSSTAISNGFEFQYSGWFRETPICFVSLDLQKSDYSNCYYLNINIHIHQLHGCKYIKSKELIRIGGDVSARQPTRYNDAFDLENDLKDDERKKILKDLFNEYLVPMTLQFDNLEDMKEYFIKERFILFPRVKKIFGIDETKQRGEA